ncbi:bleomycin resistance protein [Robiginitalea sp. IMCC44478]|uniref:bleomycin resistance protein n=1 Tax=Robiginitalea sp. IMCC44478 TaxID=3459122 RepID=UPI00404287B8
MLKDIHPKLPMRDNGVTRWFYLNQLGFNVFGNADFDSYLMMEKDQIQIHFFEFRVLDPKESYRQVNIRTDNIEAFYNSLLEKGTPIHPNEPLETKAWEQKEFSILDPDHNLLTFGQAI